MPDETEGQTPSQAPDQATSPDTELEKRLTSLIKTTVAGSVGSHLDRLSRIEQMLGEQTAAREREAIARMTPEQTRELATKSVSSGARPPASDYFKALAQEFVAEAGVEVDLPSFDSGKSTEEYERLYRQVRKSVLDKTTEKLGSESKRAIEAEVKRILAEKGVDVVDAGTGTSGRGDLSWVKAQRIKNVNDISDAEYEKLVAATR